MSLILLSLLASCAADDHACRAVEFQRLAREPGLDHEGKVRRLYLAHREYMVHYKQARSAGVLCDAQRVLAELKAEAPLPAWMSLTKTAAEAAGYEREAAVSCTPTDPAPHATRPSALPRKVAAQTSRPAEPVVEPPGTRDLLEVPLGGLASPARPANDPTPSPSPVASLGSTRTSTTSTAASSSSLPPPRHRPPRLTQDGQGQAIAGAALTGLGIGLVGLAAGALSVELGQVEAIRRQTALVATQHRAPTAGEQRWVEEHADRARTMWTVTISAGTTGVLSLATGIALLVTRKRAQRPLALRPYGGPFGAGLLVRGQF